MRVFFITFLCIGLSAAVPAWADGKRGLTLGLGGVTSEVVGDNDPFFPAIQTDSKQFMFIPNIRYDWDEWSIGANGIGWEKENEDGLSPRVTIGYPMSQAGVQGQRGWFRYGLNGRLSYSDGVGGQLRATAGPLNYTIKTGFGDRNDELGHEVSLGAPIYINRDIGLTVIGSGYLKFENAAFIEDELNLTRSITDEDYVHSGLNAFAIFRFNERASLLFSANVQFNDEDLTRQITDLNDPQFDVFTMFSYFFGKLPTKID